MTAAQPDRRFQTLVEGSIQGVLVHRDQRPLFVNRAWAEIHGYSVQEVLALDTVLPLVAEHEHERLMEYMHARMHGRPAPQRYEYEGVHRTGRRLWLENLVTTIDWDGAPAVLATVIDISERKRVEQRLHAEQLRFRDLVEGSLQGILVHRDLKPLFVNPAWAAIFGYTVDEVLQAESVLQFLAPAERARMRGFQQARLSGKKAPQRYQFRGLRKDGAMIWLENAVRVVDWDGAPAIQSTVIDITDRKQLEAQLLEFNERLEQRVALRTEELAAANRSLQAEIEHRRRAEQELRNSQALYASLVENIPLCVARKDLAGRFVFANGALRKVMGRELDEIIGRDDFAFSPPELAEKYIRDDRRVVETGALLEFEERSDLGDAGVRYIHTMKTPIRDAAGNIVGTQLIFWDVTRERENEIRRREAQAEVEQRNRDLETLLYVISHDLKEPLRAIQSFSHLLEKRSAAALDEKARDWLRRVRQSGDRMMRLLDDVLMLSRAQRTVRPEPNVPLREIVDDVLAQLEPRIHETGAVIAVADDLPVLTVDRRWVAQAVQNLVANALKFAVPAAKSQPAGAPSADTPPADTPPAAANDNDHAGDAEPDIEIASWDERIGDTHEIGLVVRDRGPGVPPEDRERIFELFQRAVGRRIEGTGAGLAIVQQVAQRHGGRAFVRPRHPQGSEFILVLAATRH